MNKGESFKNRLDHELNEIRFTGVQREKVLAKAGNASGRIKYLLDKEIRIPVKPLAAAVLIAICFLAYGLAGIAKVSDTDMQKSRIVVTEHENGSNGDGIYKN